MKPLLCIGFLWALSLWAQPAGAPMVTMEAELQPEAVVATIGGQPVTYGELQAVLRALSPEMAQQAMSDRKRFVEQYGLLRRLTEMAEQQKLDQRSPYKEGIAYSRMQVLYQAVISEKFSQIAVTPEETQKFYDANRDRYTQARVRVIYISFSNNPPPQTDPQAKKALNEAEAKAKADGLMKQLRAGADFVKLVKEHSEDATSAAKDGDFGTIRRSDQIPDEIKNVIFSLKSGEAGGPVRQPNGFYLFRPDEVSTQKLDEVRASIQEELRNSRFLEWMEEMKKGAQVTEKIPAFFSPQTFALPMPSPPK